MLKKTLKIGVLLLLLALAAIQFARPRFYNPPVMAGQRIQDFHDIPKPVFDILQRSCADCHSNETKYPWYSQVAPVSWSISDHIRVGRDELNFSEWGSYSERKRKHKLEEICEQIEDGEMPHWQYLWLHWDAAIDVKQKELICNWTKTVRAQDFGQIGTGKIDS